MRLSDLASLIAQLASDSANRLTPEDRAAALAAAVERYSADAPRRAVADLAPIAGALDLPDDWEAEFSAALNLEHPVGHRPPRNLPNEGWYLYDSPDGTQIIIVPDWLSEGDARLTYSLRHAYDEAADTITIPDKHLEAVASWGAALLCEQLASYYAANTDTTIQADTVDHTSPARTYQSRADKLRKRYLDELGVDTRRNVAAGAVATPVPRNSVGGPRLTHPLRPWRRGA